MPQQKLVLPSFQRAFIQNLKGYFWIGNMNRRTSEEEQNRPFDLGKSRRATLRSNRSNANDWNDLHVDDVPAPAKKRRRNKRKNEGQLQSSAASLAGNEDSRDPLQRLVDDCDFYLKILPPKPTTPPIDPFGLLGTLEFQLIDYEGRDYNLLDTVFKTSSVCWMYISTMSKRSFLYHESIDKDVSFVSHCLLNEKEYPINYNLMEALRCKKYALKLVSPFDSAIISSSENIFRVNVYLMKSGAVLLSHPSETSKCRDYKAVSVVMNHFFGTPRPSISDDDTYNETLDVDGLFDAVRRYHEERDAAESISTNNDVQHLNLLPRLRPYQMEVVRWWLKRERQHWQRENQSDNTLHPLYHEIILRQHGSAVYFNPYSGYLTAIKPIRGEYLPGGILADEMGLGKTIEVIAGILCHPRPDHTLWNKENNVTENVCDEHLRKNSIKRESIFECICGSDLSLFADENMKIQCESCKLWQHAKCVNYDIGDDAIVNVNYYCPHCWILMPRISSRATLIVAPASISHQWVDEVEKHVKRNSLKLLVYNGVYSGGYMQPQSLADHDIVIMSYTTMRKEMDYVDLPHTNSEKTRKLRYPKRFMAIPTPLVTINWWRVCLDEAQMIEYSTTKAAEMALRLNAVNRWCITGTPIQKSINDLYGLILFLGLDPYYVREWWKQCIAEPYFRGNVKPLYGVIAELMWRTSKKNVLEQIGLPPQSEEIHFMSFTPIEEEFYKWRQSQCSFDVDSFRQQFPLLDTKVDSVDHRIFDKLMADLLRLRQACFHPQLAGGKLLGSIGKDTMTMDEVLEFLIKKSTLKCESFRRYFVAAMNGLAGIDIIEENYGKAVDKYREILKSAKELEPRIRTDKLQLIHALKNLIEMLEDRSESIILSDDDVANIREDADELRAKYLEKSNELVRSNRNALNLATNLVNDKTAAFTCETPWWAAITSKVACTREENDLVTRVITALDNANIDNGHDSKLRTFFDCRGMQYVVKEHVDKLKESRSTLSDTLLVLEQRLSKEDVGDSIGCHLRPDSFTRRGTNKCAYCQAEEIMNRYESLLFQRFEKNEPHEDWLEPGEPNVISRRGGTWAVGETEIIMREVLAFSRIHEGEIPKEWIEDGETQITLFEALKKEFKALRGVWMQLMNSVSELDELAMANTRLRLRLPDEQRSVLPQPDVIELEEINNHKSGLDLECKMNDGKLKESLGQLLYLETLAKSECEKRQDRCENQELCPICRQKLGSRWCILECGHCFCLSCIRFQATNVIGAQQRTQNLISLKCGICRHSTKYREISHVCTQVHRNSKEDNIKVVGSNSTKVDSVIRKVMLIRLNDPSAKILVFSTWQIVLKHLAKAMGQNQIEFCSLFHSNNKYHMNLNRFKVDPEVGVLLLPIKSGANGLNLIEATHVILVEPILNPASELQAIGRVHRIGQTKPTVVHRFLVRASIEEHLYNVLFNMRQSSNDSTPALTIQNLLDVFVAAL